jgi:hypothetical protein
MRLLIALLILMAACNSDSLVELDTNTIDLVDIPNHSKIIEFYESYSASGSCSDSVTALNVYRVRTENDTLYVLEPCTEMYWTPRRIKNSDKPLWLLDDGPPPGHTFKIALDAKIPLGAKCAFGTVKTLTR